MQTPQKKQQTKQPATPEPTATDIQKAHDQAEADIAQDADIAQTTQPEEDLDEGELARLDNSND